MLWGISRPKKPDGVPGRHFSQIESQSRTRQGRQRAMVDQYPAFFARSHRHFSHVDTEDQLEAREARPSP